MYKELMLRYKDFDLESTLEELNRWQNELEDTLEDEITRNVLLGVKDIILDNCTFE